MTVQDKTYTYYMPHKTEKVGLFAKAVEKTTQTNSVIIIGANGSGKSRLGAWLEAQHRTDVHRIAAQRNLELENDVRMMGEREAQKSLFYGSSNVGTNDPKINRWPQEVIDGVIQQKNTTSTLNDYQFALAALLAKNRVEINDYRKQNILLAKEGKPVLPPSPTTLDILQNLWNSIFPHRNLTFEDNTILSYISADSYFYAKNMSDGERVALYLIAQALCLEAGKTLIVDEPEIHLHRSIMNRLWDAITNLRADCLFIFITHDTKFAADHPFSDKYWLKSFDGTFWDYEPIEPSQLPQQLLMDILGNRKNVLFVEGTSDSHDTKLYTLLYPDYYIVPCGSCTNVIINTKAFKQSSQLTDYIHAYGIIDRDYRSQTEIESLAPHDIYVLNIAEVENLFLCEGILKTVASHMGVGEDAVSSAKDYIIDTKFSNMIANQITKATSSELLYQASMVKTDSETSFKTSIADLNYLETYKSKDVIYQAALQTRNYQEILKLFNEKGLAGSISNYFGINSSRYYPLVISLTAADPIGIRTVLQAYLPSQIP